jgi:hypothetical protein
MWAASTRGPLAAPGTYQVRVTVDGQTETQPFAVRREPHVLKTSPIRICARSSTLAIKVRDKASQANEACCWSAASRRRSRSERQARRQVGAGRQGARRLRRGAERDRGRDLPGEAAEQPGSAELPDQVEQQDRGAAGRDRERRRRPTEQAYSVFRTLSNGLDEQLGRLDTNVKGKMPPVNQLLQRLKLDPIKAEPLKPEPPKTAPSPQ